MAKLILRPTDKNHRLAETLRNEGQNIKYNVTTAGLEITGERITITREVANRILSLDKLDAQNAIVQWRGLMLNREGQLIAATDDIIIVADEADKSQWSSVRVRRDTKEYGELWATRMGISQAKFYEEAIKSYVDLFRRGGVQPQ